MIAVDSHYLSHRGVHIHVSFKEEQGYLDVIFISNNAWRRNMQDFSDFQSVMKFHGYACPALIVGYRTAGRAMEELGVKRSDDEELVVIVMNDTCAVNAVQHVAGCTFGKGDLIRISESTGFEVRKVDHAFYDHGGKVLFRELTQEDVAEVQRRAP